MIKNKFTSEEPAGREKIRGGEGVYSHKSKIPTVTIGGMGAMKVAIPNSPLCRQLTITERERAFGLQDGETAMPGVSLTARKKALGGAWTVKQMAHVMQCINKSVPWLGLFPIKR